MSDTVLAAPDHYSGEFAADPYPALARLREQCPVAHSDAHEGFWFVASYEHVREVTRRTESFSSRYTSVPKDIGFGDIMVPPLQLDPPEHDRFKRLLANAFAPHRAKEMEGQVRAHVRTVLGALLDKGGPFDASYDFARIIPTYVVCELLGCPEAVDQFTNWVQRMLEQASSNIADAQLAAMDMFTYLATAVAERRANPGSDMISFLTKETIDGDALDDGEIISVAALLLLAGVDTAWSTLAASIHHLALHPDDQARLREHPAEIETAREEFLRAYAPVTVGRIVKADTELNGCPMSAGEMLLVSFPSANRDESAFPAADKVILDRSPNPHLAFGSGIHRCLGVNVARMEIKVALEELLAMVPPFTLDENSAVIWTAGQVRGPKTLVINPQGS